MIEDTADQNSATKFFISLIGIATLGFILKELAFIFLPFIIAYLLFFLFSPINTFLWKKKIPTIGIILLNIVLMIILSGGAIRLLFDSLMQFSEYTAQYIVKLNSIVRATSASIGLSDPFFINFSVENVLAGLNAKTLISDLLTSFFDFSGYIFFILLFFAFIVSGHKSVYDAIKKRYIAGRKDPTFTQIEKKYYTQEFITDDESEIEKRIEKEKNQAEAELAFTFKAINIQIQRYIVGKIGLNLLAGVVIGFALLLFGVDFPILWGILAFLLNFIPTIGSIITLAFPTLISLLQFESFAYTIIIAVTIMGIQTIVFNMLEPIFMGNRLGLNPIAIIISVLVWGYVWGIVGMLLAAPLTAIIKIILSSSESKNVKFFIDLIGKE